MTTTLPQQTESCPRQTPWGHADQVTSIAPGIWSVSTPGHGGIYLAQWRRAGLPDYITDGTGYSSDGWFEEDCDWALACAAFPIEFGPRSCFYALATIQSGSDYLAQRRALYLASPLAAVLRAEATKFNPQAESEAA